MRNIAIQIGTVRCTRLQQDRGLTNGAIAGLVKDLPAHGHTIWLARRKISKVLVSARASDVPLVSGAGRERTASRLSLSYSADGRHVVAVDGASGIVWLASRTGKVIARRHPELRLGAGQVPPAGAAHVTAVSPDGRFIAWPAPNGTVLIYDGRLPKTPTTQPAPVP